MNLLQILTDLSILVLIIMSILFVLILRQAMGIRISKKYNCSPAQKPIDLNIIADILPNMEEQLARLGFSLRCVLGSQNGIHELKDNVPFLVYQSKDETVADTFICLNYPASVSMPNDLIIQCFSVSDNERIWMTEKNDASSILNNSVTPIQTVDEDNLATVLHKHREFVKESGETIRRQRYQPSELSEVLNDFNKKMLFECTKEKRIVEANTDTYRLTLLTAITFIYHLFFKLPKKFRAQVQTYSIPLSRQAWLDKLHTHIYTQREPPKQFHAVQLLVTMALSVLLGYWWIGIWHTLMIVMIIVIHELGHYAMMKYFGYRRAHMLMLPLVGGVTMGEEAQANSNHRLWVLLMGPLPGIVLGTVLLVPYFLYGFSMLESNFGAYVIVYAVLSLFINMLNLLPFGPLDGAQILNLLFPVKYYQFKGYLLTVFAVLGLCVCFYYELYLIVFLIILTFPKMKQIQKHQAVLASLPQTTNIGDVLANLQAQEGDPKNLANRLTEANQLLRESQCKPLSKVNLFFAIMVLFSVIVAITWFIFSYDTLMMLIAG